MMHFGNGDKPNALHTRRMTAMVVSE